MPRDRKGAGRSWPGDGLTWRIGADLGVLIADSRRAAGLTQRELAALALVPLGTVRDVEQGRSPRSRALARLASALGLDIGWTKDPKAMGKADAAPAVHGAVQSAGRHGGQWLRVLGPVEAWRGGRRVDLGPPRQRAVLGLLALSPREIVRRETVIDALWGEDPPATAASLVQAYASRLRRVLDAGRSPRRCDGVLAAVGTAYRLDCAAGQLDLLAFWQLVDRARAARLAGDATAACGLYESALRLWRGDPAADVDLLRGSSGRGRPDQAVRGRGDRVRRGGA